MAKAGREHYASVTCKNKKCRYYFEVTRTMLMNRDNSVKAKCPYCRESNTVVLNKQRDI